ncbi:hypothetical protein [Iningainema tapete]|uniref:HTH cro/C1-type domain-containing protein n=1 Tax=Iningainema tapete BLCC-T55 TaxID=2748662 RepID=A0A8J6XJ51_9CYAN|nr:hypothetical protein [Iningainema tapete]MBD2771202.1 hypothetical protein [Iningainema tapete BLCC-T55]
MSRTLYTLEGLQKLAEIVNQARGHMSYRDFGDKIDISHTTLRRIAQLEVKEPEISTLAKLAPHTPYSLEELIAICQSSNAPTRVRTYKTAEDVLPAVEELPPTEAARLAQMIIARLAGLKT